MNLETLEHEISPASPPPMALMEPTSEPQPCLSSAEIGVFAREEQVRAARGLLAGVVLSAGVWMAAAFTLWILLRG